LQSPFIRQFVAQTPQSFFGRERFVDIVVVVVVAGDVVDVVGVDGGVELYG